MLQDLLHRKCRLMARTRSVSGLCELPLVGGEADMSVFARSDADDPFETSVARRDSASDDGFSPINVVPQGAVCRLLNSEWTCSAALSSPFSAARQRQAHGRLTRARSSQRALDF